MRKGKISGTIQNNERYCINYLNAYTMESMVERGSFMAFGEDLALLMRKGEYFIWQIPETDDAIATLLEYDNRVADEMVSLWDTVKYLNRAGVMYWQRKGTTPRKNRTTIEDLWNKAKEVKFN